MLSGVYTSMCICIEKKIREVFGLHVLKNVTECEKHRGYEDQGRVWKGEDLILLMSNLTSR